MSAGDEGRPDGTGRLLAGRYRVVRQLGRGGMGVVWQARDEVLGREVAVKELRTYTDAAAPELTELGLRMRREARAAARVRHRAVIAVHDVAEVDGRPLIVMELVDGPSLDDVLHERGTLQPPEAARIGAEVMDALAAAHRAGVVHRDVKPGNILLDRSGRIVLTDFGIATMEDPGDGSATHLTRSGELVGSLDYLAPERARGAEPGPASDVWALGATLYAAVEGTAPFRRTSAFSTLTAIVEDPLPEPGRAGPLAPVLHRLMEKAPDARPRAEEARDLLRSVAGAAGPDATAAPGPTAAPHRPAAPAERTETELDVPAARAVRTPPPPPVPPSGPPQARDLSPGAAAQAAPGPRPRQGRLLLAAVAAVVVLTTAGVTVALVGLPDGGRADARTGATTPGPGRTGADPLRTPEAAGDDGDGDKGNGSRDDGRDSGSGTDTPARDSAGPTEPTAPATPVPTATGPSSGEVPGAGAPACHAIGGGRYNCHVGRTAASYTAAGTRKGVLKEGTNYFYCQQNLGRRETYRKWTNVWWARTDDDSGNKDVWVSVVYVRGGANDGPVPGLPVC
ncbi:serine/threonine-protein kinase [Streptomyces sp. enrichment culture]|uniref:serine/threonine-protein kinase n=1 Tax=Streptomyces sp. enrichment culture TaxID=1795815 RepID=UPI003F562A4A